MFLSGYRFIKEKEEQRKTIDVLENQNEIGYSGSFSCGGIADHWCKYSPAPEVPGMQKDTGCRDQAPGSA